MIIEVVPKVLPIHFNNERVKTLLYDDNGICSVISTKDELLRTFSTKVEVAYNRQYGTPISSDARFVFIGTWRKGLFCHSLENGTIIWHERQGKVGKIIVENDLLIIQMIDRGVHVRNLQTGELIREFKMSSMRSFYRLDHNTLFAGPKNNYYFLLEIPSLNIKTRIKEKALNIQNCLSFIILNVYYFNHQLVIEGWEQYCDGNPQNDKQKDFKRTVFL